MERSAAERKTSDGTIISSSSVRRLENEVKQLKNEHDSLRIKILTQHNSDQDLAKTKTDSTRLEQLKVMIAKKETLILDIKLGLKALA